MKKPLKEPKPKSGWQVILAVFILLVSCSPRNHTHYSVDDPRRSYNNQFAPVNQHKPHIKH
jgi:hypothetical protein